MQTVAIFNPETKGLDCSTVSVDKFTVQAVFEALDAKNWHYQPGTYVAIRVEDEKLEDKGGNFTRFVIDGSWNTCLTFTVQESERIVTERIAVPA